MPNLDRHSQTREINRCSLKPWVGSNFQENGELDSADLNVGSQILVPCRYRRMPVQFLVCKSMVLDQHTTLIFARVLHNPPSIVGTSSDAGEANSATIR